MTDYHLNEMMQIALFLMLERFFYDKRYKVGDKVRMKYFSVSFVDHSIYLLYLLYCLGWMFSSLYIESADNVLCIW